MKRIGSRPGRVASALLVCAVSFAAACIPSSGDDEETTLATDTLTRRQKDSIASTLPVPGAGAIGRAMQASDLAADRALAHDTLH